jgi:hypothetical protein
VLGGKFKFLASDVVVDVNLVCYQHTRDSFAKLSQFLVPIR